MKTQLRGSLIVLTTLLLATACAGQSQRVSDSTAEPPPAVPAPGVLVPSPTGNSLSEGLAPIPNHPPVTMSGRLKSVDPKLGSITFEDGRTAMLSKESEVYVPASIDRVRPGIPIVVQHALPVGLWSGTAPAGKSQRMATVESVDESDHVIQLTDGTAVRVPPSTPIHVGVDGSSLALADVEPGDELIIVMTEDANSTKGDRDATPSASPRSSTAESPRPVAEVMIFRPTWTP